MYYVRCTVVIWVLGSNSHFRYTCIQSSLLQLRDVTADLPSWNWGQRYMNKIFLPHMHCTNTDTTCSTGTALLKTKHGTKHSHFMVYFEYFE